MTSEPKGPDGLTDRQRAFVAEYMIDLNATQAYIRAGYAPKAADANASTLMGVQRVAEAIARAKADRARRTGVTADRVIRELAAVGFARLPDVAKWGADDLALTDSDQLTDDDARAIQSVTQTEKFIKTIGEGETLMSRERTIKLHDKVKALTKLGDHIGLWKKDPEQTGDPLRIVIVEDE